MPDIDSVAEYAAAQAALRLLLTPADLERWQRQAAGLAAISPQAAATFCSKSTEALAAYGPAGMLEWGSGALRLARRYRQGGHVALAALDLSGGAVRTVRTGLVRLALRHGPDSHLEAAAVIASLLVSVGGLHPTVQRRLLKVMQATAEHHPMTLETVAWTCSGWFSKLPLGDFREFLGRFEALVASAPGTAMNLLHETVVWRRLTDPHRRIVVFDLAIDLAAASPRCAFQLVRAAESLCERLTDDAIPEWYRAGHDLLPALEDEAANYFGLTSRTSLEHIRRLSPGVALEDVREVLRMYAQALTGQAVNLVTTAGMPLVQGVWTPETSSGADVPVVFAAPLMDRLPTKDANFSNYKVTVTHQTGHFTFGTYRFDFERDGGIFGSLRAMIVPGSREIFPTPLDRYFALFRHSRLAHDLFSVSEDARVDARVWGEYRGIRSSYATVQQHTLAARPDASLLPLREYLIEQLIRYNLHPEAVLDAPRPFVHRVRQALGLMDLLAGRTPGTPQATVEDAAEATLRLYILMRAVPNLPLSVIPQEQWMTVDPATAAYDPALDDLKELLAEFMRVNQAEGEGVLPPEMQSWEEPEAPYQSPQTVDHHAEPKPEQMQNLLEAQTHAEESAFEDVQRIIQQVAEEMREREEQGSPQPPNVILDSSEKPDANLWSTDPSKAIPDARSLRNRSPSVMESITDDQGVAYYYDEWDYRIGGFRPRWCRVIEHKLAEGRGEFYHKTVQQYPGLVLAVRRQFEMLRPQGMAPAKRLLDGEDFDLDALIESVVDKRSGNGQDDKIYWRRRSSQRSVAVSVLLDMSFSTGERVDEDIRYYSARYLQDATPGMSPEMSHNTATKRIIELEKEALVLLIEALERLGDPYGIYGFSSAGRAEVRYYVLKDPEEPASAQVKARIDSVVPLQGTRIGPAVRHAAQKLASAQAHTKLLLLLTDGRPQDKDYGETTWDPHGGVVRHMPDSENEYAVHDTKAALNEARAKGITPFVVSIDKEGHDYLKMMCGDLGYEVVSNLEALPRRLPSLYRRLTT